jgi:hypothetical protein
MKIQLTETESIEISLEDLTEQIFNESQYLRSDYTEEELQIPDSDFSGIDCRLRVFDGDWSLITGDSQFDTDHRGYWAYGSIPYYCTLEEAQEIAESLIKALEEEQEIAESLINDLE